MGLKPYFIILISETYSNKQCAVGAAEVTVWSCLTRTDDQTKLVAGHSLGLIVTGGIQHGHHKATRTAAAIKGSP